VGAAWVFYTSNRGKYLEVRRLMGRQGIPVRWGRRTLQEPQAANLQTVVRAKLLQVSPPPGGFALVEDSGLFIPSLGGFPGVYSSHALKTLGLEGLLRAVRGRPRAATFVAVVGLKGRGTVRISRGEVRGSLAPEPRGKGGFGFDPIFVPEGRKQTFAEMGLEEKTRISHRAVALRRLGRALTAPDHRPGPTE
jgi:XTP/dITP diphosphohydrolase